MRACLQPPLALFGPDRERRCNARGVVVRVTRAKNTTSRGRIEEGTERDEKETFAFLSLSRRSETLF